MDTRDGATAATMRSPISDIGGDRADARQQFVAQAAQELAEAEGVVSTRGDAMHKADQRHSLQRLTAPVSGVVQEVSVTTIGEVPPAGKPSVTIVPDGEVLVVEAPLMNRDAGFVHAGDRTVIKLEAYPFTRYGSLDGVVEHVSPEATVDQQRGLAISGAADPKDLDCRRKARSCRPEWRRR